MRWDRWLIVGCLAAAAGVTGFLAYGGHHLFRRDRAAATERAKSIGIVRPAESPQFSAATDATTGEDTGEDSEANSLAPEYRKYIWDIEHIALVLDVHVFPRFAKALRDAVAEDVSAFLSDDFAGRLVREESIEGERSECGEFRWTRDAADSVPAIDRTGFIAFLMRQRAVFPESPKAEVRLMRLSPVERGNLSGTWQGTMKIRLAGERGPGKPTEIEVQVRFTVDHPTDEVLERTGWIKSASVYSWRQFDAPAPLMHDVAAERGIDPKRFLDNWEHPDQPPRVVQGGVYLCDFDRDNRLDVLVPDANGIALFQNTGDGSFTDVAESSGLAREVKRPASPAIFVDLDGDAYEDLIIGTQVFRNNRDATFSDVTAITNLRLPKEQGAYAVADYDLDGQMDIYVVRASPGPVGQSRVSWVDDQTGPGNLLWKNLGNWRFRNVTEATNASAGHRSCFAAVWLDANCDGRPDIAASDEFGSTVLLINQPDGRFTERICKEPFGGFCMGITAGDFDNDGHVDLYLANMFSKAGDRIIANLPPDAYTPELRAKIEEFVVGSELLRGAGDGSFTAIGRAMNVHGIGWAYGPNLVDLDNDGWLDIYAPAGFLSYTRGEPDG
jgi:hypothetical protein